jgi:hypothetical protein
MTKRKLAVVLASTAGLVGAVDLSLVLGLAFTHRPYAIPLLSLMGCIPGFVIAALAWQGRLRSNCGAAQ